MSDLIKGLYPKPKHERAPDFVIGKLNINVPQFREWMAAWIKANPGEEWVRVDMKVSREGKGYAAVDDWEPNQDGEPAKPAPKADDIPF